MSRPRIHLISPAGSCRPFLRALALNDVTKLATPVQQAVGERYEVTADAAILAAGENETSGGRVDDLRRAADIEHALGDDAVAAIVTVRGGAWFTRVMQWIDFSVLERRTRPVAVFGFSELTPLVNVVGSYATGRGVYDMGPAFLVYGLKRFGPPPPESSEREDAGVPSWLRQRVLDCLKAFFEDVVSMLEGRGTSRRITAELIQGEIDGEFEASFVGGNLTVVSAMLGTKFDASVNPAGRWLVLEDFNDKLERFDRYLAHLTLAGWWQHCQGLLLGDFHQGERDLLPGVLALLGYHLPENRRLPVLRTREVGHVWPMSPLPLHTTLTCQHAATGHYQLCWPGAALQVV